MHSARLSVKGRIGGHVEVPGSKSESNRLLVLQALFPDIGIENISTSDDTVVLQKALEKPSGLIDIGHAGTAMRFLTAYFAATSGDPIVLTGSQRMKQRPIGILVDALRELGAMIDYVENDGFPPVRFHRNGLNGNSVKIGSNVSSQFITALMLIAPALPEGLQIEILGQTVSRPYLQMTASILRLAGIDARQMDNFIRSPAVSRVSASITVESDWSSASYFYSIVALSPIGTRISLSSFGPDSLQGDRAVSRIYERFGVTTEFESGKIILTKKSDFLLKRLEMDFADYPDLTQTVAATCLGLSIPFAFTGLKTLRIKETDRILALANELNRLGGNASIVGDVLHFTPGNLKAGTLVQTYGDHRMALAFSAIAVRMPIVIEDFGVVSKSFPGYGSELQKLGFELSH